MNFNSTRLSRLSSSGCKSGAIGMKQGGHSRLISPHFVCCVDTIDAVLRCRQDDY